MEQYKVYLFKDSKSETYGPPFIQENIGSCLRFLNEQVEYTPPAQRPAWAKHPQDFCLFEVGEYDARNGKITQYEAKNSVGLAQDFLTSLGKTN